MAISAQSGRACADGKPAHCLLGRRRRGQPQQRFLWERIEEQLGRLHKRITPEDAAEIENLIEKLGSRLKAFLPA
jgi:hypothetical protein